MAHSNCSRRFGHKRREGAILIVTIGAWLAALVMFVLAQIQGLLTMILSNSKTSEKLVTF